MGGGGWRGRLDAVGALLGVSTKISTRNTQHSTMSAAMRKVDFIPARPNTSDVPTGTSEMEVFSLHQAHSFVFLRYLSF